SSWRRPPFFLSKQRGSISNGKEDFAADSQARHRLVKGHEQQKRRPQRARRQRPKGTAPAQQSDE
ncbi:MAG: hypothetical protein V2A73_08410, partial [Pseudomonadota bacterium]